MLVNVFRFGGQTRTCAVFAGDADLLRSLCHLVMRCRGCLGNAKVTEIGLEWDRS